MEVELTIEIQQSMVI